MQQEYDDSFKKQFGSLESDGALNPPTSSAYNKVSSILGGSSNVASSISIETFHSITPPVNDGNRNRSQRVPQLVVSFQEMMVYRNEYQKTTSDSKRQDIIQSFWSQVVYPKALEVWNQQNVMSELGNITSVIVDKLTLQSPNKAFKLYIILLLYMSILSIYKAIYKLFHV
jgi:hypothetical protein